MNADNIRALEASLRDETLTREELDRCTAKGALEIGKGARPSWRAVRMWICSLSSAPWRRCKPATSSFSLGLRLERMQMRLSWRNGRKRSAMRWSLARIQ